jgi:CheY-like chemotaxis protein
LDPQVAIFKLNDYSPNSFAVRTPECPVVCKVLVVEDEALQGLNVMATLSRAGIEAVGPYPTVSGAFAAIEERTFDAALVDINLNGVPSFDVAATLRQKGIPFAFVTAYERTLPEEFRSVPNFGMANRRPASRLLRYWNFEKFRSGGDGGCEKGDGPPAPGTPIC